MTLNSNQDSMQNLGYFFILMCLMGRSAGAVAQTTPSADSPQTLEWVERQAWRIDSMISDAMRGSEPIEILVRLTDCFQVFDAISMAGLYCTDIRAAAEAGRNQCDVINYRLEKDLNSKLQRAVEARKQAIRMKEAVKVCKQNLSKSANSFTPNDLLKHEAHMAELYLLDGMATEDLHIMSQKLEWVIRTLHDVEHLARSLSDCSIPLELAERAVIDCQTALAAPNWHEVHLSLKSALSKVQTIQRSANCN